MMVVAKTAIVALILACAFGLTACGGAKKSAVVASVGTQTVTEAEVDHWMKVLAAGDFRQELVKPPPAGLVGEPPQYASCVAVAKKWNATRSATETTTLCRELYQATRVQAVAFLTDVLWHVQDGAEHHESVTPREVHAALIRLREREWPKPGQFQKYLAEVHRSVADEEYLLKRNLLSQKQVKRVEAEGLKAGEQSKYERLAQEYLAKWTARTSCKPGYVAEDCKEFKGAASTGPAPATVLQKLTKPT